MHNVWYGANIVACQHNCLTCSVPPLIERCLSAPHFPTYCFTLLCKMDFRPISYNSKRFWVTKCLRRSWFVNLESPIICWCIQHCRFLEGVVTKWVSPSFYPLEFQKDYLKTTYSLIFCFKWFPNLKSFGYGWKL